MSTFEVGQRVREVSRGRTGYVVEVGDGNFIGVRWDHQWRGVTYFRAHELEAA